MSAKRGNRKLAWVAVLSILGLLPLGAGAQVEEARARVDGMV
jgi:hypothetical protein